MRDGTIRREEGNTGLISLPEVEVEMDKGVSTANKVGHATNELSRRLEYV